MSHPQRTNRIRWRQYLALAAVSLVPLATISAFADDPAPPTTGRATTVGNKSPLDLPALREQIRKHLQAGELDSALERLNHALAAHPNHTALRTEGIDLYLSLAKTWMGQEEFLAAERALDAVLRLDANHVDARHLRAIILDARRRLPAQLQQAHQWLAVEWFEPAFNTLRQARGLIEQPDSSLQIAFRAAALGAGDDNYFTKSFHKAFYYYDAALQLHDDQKTAPPTLVSRWLQSLVHALSDDVGNKRYGESYWRLTISKAEHHAGKIENLQPLMILLRGLAYEAAGDARAAAQQYARIAGTASNGTIVDLRDAATRRIRSFYDQNLSNRRAGAWQSSERGPQSSLATKRFRIFHSDDHIRKQIAVALDFHLDRIIQLAGWNLSDLVWPQKIEIHIYPTDGAFTQATEQPANVTAISHIRRDGNVILDWSIHARATDPLLLSSSLPHELFHLLMEANGAAGRTPAALAEGLALHVEPPCRHRQFVRLFKSQPQPAALAELLQSEGVHPTTPEFYAQAHRLVAVIRDRVEFAKIVAAVARGDDVNRLANMAGFADASRLQRRYLRIFSEQPE